VGSSTTTGTATAPILALLTNQPIRANVERMFATSTVSPGELTLQGSLLAIADPACDASFASLERTWLDDSSWVDYQPRWLSGADLAFGELVARIDWKQRVVPMYGRMLDEPRLTWWAADPNAELPWPFLSTMAATLTGRYDKPFDSISANLYRDGRDSVTWHSDRIRHQVTDPLVAIVSVGAPRVFAMRPVGGGHRRSWRVGQGDLLVMGGACQHQWQHGVPKVAHAGPRLSVMFRHRSDLPPD
jgi:alkylated DNA repair dioxygenase AlkB